MDLNRHDEAAELLRRALALTPDNPQSVKLMGRLAFERGDWNRRLRITCARSR